MESENKVLRRKRGLACPCTEGRDRSGGEADQQRKFYHSFLVRKSGWKSQKIKKIFKSILGKYVYNRFFLFSSGPVQRKLPTLRRRPKKRKTFDQMTVYGRRRGLQDLKKLFREKEEQYQAPVSRLAGFVIQQVISLNNFCRGLIHVGILLFVFLKHLLALFETFLKYPFKAFS